MSSRWNQYPSPSADYHRGAHWKRLRGMALRRDNHECQIRVIGVCTGTASCVDLIAPYHLGGQPVLDNVQSACAPCHRLKTAREASQAAAAKRGRARRRPPIHPSDVM